MEKVSVRSGVVQGVALVPPVLTFVYLNVV